MTKIVGVHPLDKKEDGSLKFHIGNVIVGDRAVITGPGIHATLLYDYIEHLKSELNLSNCTFSEENELFSKAEASLVPLIMKDNTVFIRPDTGLDLALEADKILQEIVPKENIKFLGLSKNGMKSSIKKLGECWRINPPPMNLTEIINRVSNSKVTIQTAQEYFYNMFTGTRYLTFDLFSKIDDLSDSEISARLNEIKEFSSKKNSRLHNEVDFFKADANLFNNRDFGLIDYSQITPSGLREVYKLLKDKFYNSVNADFKKDNYYNPTWINSMLESIGEQVEHNESSTLGLSPDLYRRIKWLPGAKIEKGNLVFDSMFESNPSFCDGLVKQFISNYKLFHPNMDYINVGRLVNPDTSTLSKKEIEALGRQDTYVVIMGIKQKELIKILRMQKWGVIEHLKRGRDFFSAMRESGEYTHFIDARYQGCIKLGIDVPRLDYSSVKEIHNGQSIDSIYFQRDYIFGYSTDKIPVSFYENKNFSSNFAELLGEEAALNLIIGRGIESDKGTGVIEKVCFDDGNEILVLDGNNNPDKIILSDFTGSFRDYKTSLDAFVSEYAKPVIKRMHFLPDKNCFINKYLDSFESTFIKVQQEYRNMRMTFDSSFGDRYYDPNGSFSCRWIKILQRLDTSDASLLKKGILEEINKHLN